MQAFTQSEREAIKRLGDAAQALARLNSDVVRNAVWGCVTDAVARYPTISNFSGVGSNISRLLVTAPVAECAGKEVVIEGKTYILTPK